MRIIEVTASEEAKAAGYQSLTQVANLFSTTTETLRRWHRSNHYKFEAVLIGCLRSLKK
jgi:hypothetical protein